MALETKQTTPKPFQIALVKPELAQALQDLMCAICYNLVYEPVQTPCSHVFCNSCLKPWIEQKQTCPMDNKAVSSSSLKPLQSANPLAYRILASQLVKCPLHANEGCTWTGEYSSIANHLKSGCGEPCKFCNEFIVQEVGMKTHLDHFCFAIPLPCTVPGRCVHDVLLTQMHTLCMVR